MISQETKLEGQNKEKQMGVMEQVLHQNISRQIREAVPMRVVAGPVGGAVNGIAPAVAPEDPIFLEKTGRSLLSPALRLKNESLIAFCGRTGLSLHEIYTLSRKELERRIALRAEARKEEGVTEPRRSAQLIPDNLYVSVTCAETFNLDAHLASKLPPNMADTADLKDYYDRLAAARS